MGAQWKRVYAAMYCTASLLPAFRTENVIGLVSICQRPLDCTFCLFLLAFRNPCAELPWLIGQNGFKSV